MKIIPLLLAVLLIWDIGTGPASHRAFAQDGDKGPVPVTQNQDHIIPPGVGGIFVSDGGDDGSAAGAGSSYRAFYR